MEYQKSNSASHSRNIISRYGAKLTLSVSIGIRSDRAMSNVTCRNELSRDHFALNFPIDSEIQIDSRDEEFESALAVIRIAVASGISQIVSQSISMLVHRFEESATTPTIWKVNKTLTALFQKVVKCISNFQF
jgi:hypothetical protein